MFKPFEFCVPTKSIIIPHGPEWLHEIKYDGYRLRVERNGDRVRLMTRGGYWTDRYPWIVEAARKVRQKQLCSTRCRDPGGLLPSTNNRSSPQVAFYRFIPAIWNWGRPDCARSTCAHQTRRSLLKEETVYEGLHN
jgi:ATP dependent DNA ligase-like protein